MDIYEQIAYGFEQLSPTFNERSLRLFAAAEANAIGRGGVTRLAKITGLSRPAIQKGQREIAQGVLSSSERIRSPGAGQKKTTTTDSTLLTDLLESAVTKSLLG